MVWVVSPLTPREAARSLEAAREKVCVSGYAKPGPPYEVPCPECNAQDRAALERAFAWAVNQRMLGYAWKGAIGGSGLV